MNTLYPSSEFLEHVLKVPDSVLPIAEVLCAMSVIYVMLTRVQRSFDACMMPYKISDTEYDLSLITDRSRRAAFRDLTAEEHSRVQFAAFWYAGLLALCTYYFAHQYADHDLFEKAVHRHLFSFLAGVSVGGGVFLFVYSTRLRHELNQCVALQVNPYYVKNLSKQEGLEITPAVRVMATACNLGSQTTSIICGFPFFHKILSRLGNDSLEDALVCSQAICVMVRLLVAKHYQPRLEQNFAVLFSRSDSAVRVGNSRCQYQCIEENPQA